MNRSTHSINGYGLLLAILASILLDIDTIRAREYKRFGNCFLGSAGPL
jgi:hypothetical protein